ncbi:MAG: flagellar hook protein FlgE [Synergistaceae bacterium]|jgi:flagellar hook protein FlgE|nr:flagellar hook protein FlgE [Synergistaceae bacterium]
MQRSLYTATSGVKIHQTYLDVTGHNIANVNTVGYKRDAVQFADIISQTVRNAAAPVSPPGGLGPAQAGLGARLASISPCFTQGSIQNTDMSSDMAIIGDGFFVVNDRGNQLYTRAGDFALDVDGNLVTQGGGYFVQGFKFNGASEENSLSGIVIPAGDVMNARATAVAAFRCNLDSRGEARVTDPDASLDAARPFVYTGSADVSASASSVSSQDVIDAFGSDMLSSSDWADSFTVYDEDGEPRIMNVVFRKALDKPADPTANPPASAETEWDWYAYYADAPDYGEGAGTLVFGDDGLLRRTYTFNPSGWSVVENNIAAGNNGNPTGLVGAGSGAPINLDFLGNDYAAAAGLPPGGLIDAVTSYGSSSTTKMKGQDGYPQGILDNWSVNSSGVINGLYTNGETRQISRVAVARFINPQGLSEAGATCFEETADSGAARIMTPGEGGAGTIKGLASEMSNVELSEEFVNLIRSQRGLQANTKAVTTSDRILETLINLKR